MHHGEKGAALPRRVSNVASRQLCDGHNNRTAKQWKGGNLFHVAEADMKKVSVEKKPRRKVIKPIK